MMLILDSNHLRELRIPGPICDRLRARLLADGRDVVTTIINVEEGIKGYFSQIKSARNTSARVAAYANLHSLLEYYSDWVVLPFDAAAAGQYDRLRSLPELRRLGMMDLQIAAIALCHHATVLTRNL